MHLVKNIQLNGTDNCFANCLLTQNDLMLLCLVKIFCHLILIHFFNLVKVACVHLTQNEIFHYGFLQ